MDASEILRKIGAVVDGAMNEGLGEEGFLMPFEDSDITDPGLSASCRRLETFFSMVNESYRYAASLASGALDCETSRANFLAMPLKALHANLRHLTWQTGQVARGDLNHQVYFMGEFSESFNSMIASLRDKQVIEQRLKTITDVVGEGVYLVDAAANLTFMNPEAEKLLGYHFEELHGRNIHEIICRQYPEGTFLDFRRSPLFRSVINGVEYRNSGDVFTCKSGLPMPVSLVCRPIIQDGRNTGAVIAFHDITEQKKYQESLQLINELLERQATTDPLTGVYNRLKLNNLLEYEMGRAARYSASLSVILLDIDKFKDINDAYGHLSGDSVLKDLAALISSNKRSVDILARWGGEEFMIVIPGISIEQARLFAEKLRMLIAGHSFSIGRQVTASFGVAAWVGGDTDSSLTGRADKALYHAKNNGRNRVEACH